MVEEGERVIRETEFVKLWKKYFQKLLVVEYKT